MYICKIRSDTKPATCSGWSCLGDQPATCPNLIWYRKGGGKDIPCFARTSQPPSHS